MKFVALLRRCDLVVAVVCAFAIALGLLKDESELLRAGAPCVGGFVVLSVIFKLRARPRWLGRHGEMVAAALVIVAALGLSGDRHALLRALTLELSIALPLIVLLRARFILRHVRELLLLAVSSALAVLALHAAGPFVLAHFVLPDYDLDVDHHPKPNGPETNEDGLRTKRPSSDFKKEDFNIVFLGDSFTWGLAVPSDDNFVTGVERTLRERYPDRRINTINMGWTSSSPLLQRRRLLQLGARYKPDLVVQCFDMTDFHDDLTYAEQFRDEDAPGGGGEITIFQALAALGNRLLGVADARRWWLRQMLFDEAEGGSRGRGKHKADKPNERFFFLFRPRQESEPHARITWDAIQKTAEVSRRLGARFELFILPRYQQYNRNEAPADPEKPEFPASDEYLYEPFHYFADKAATAPFPIHSLLGAFQHSGVFPTTPASDPHWNAAGNRIAADAISRFLIDDGVMNQANE